MSTVSLPAVAPVVEPRAAGWAADGAFWMWRAIERWLDARSVASPALAGASGEAAAVREFARQYMTSDPGFAADLLAAADRHEQLSDAG